MLGRLRRPTRAVYVFHQFLGDSGGRNVGGVYSHVRNYNRIAAFSFVLIALSESERTYRRGRTIFLGRRLRHGPLLLQYALALLMHAPLIWKIRNRRTIMIERPELAVLLWPR